jgi:capsid protein
MSGKIVTRSRLQSIGSSYYDASKSEDTRSQSWVAWPQTAEKEFTYWNRLQLLKKKRALEANLGFVGAMIEKVGRYSVGRGLFPIPQTKDVTWAEDACKKFDDWASNPIRCDAMGLMTVWEMQKWNAETYFGEGEAFTGLIKSARAGAPQLQMFDNGEMENRMGSPKALNMMSPGETTYWDGVKLNKSGRVLAYCVRTSDGGDYVDVQAENIIHICKRIRPGQYRGITPFHASENSAIDVMDIKGLEIASAKLHSALAMVFTKQSGAGVGSQGLFGALQQITQAAHSTNGVDAGLSGTYGPSTAPATGSLPGKNQLMETINSGGGMVHLKEGEDVKFLTSTRASTNTLDFLVFLLRDLSTSTGLPLEFLWDMSEMGGANARVSLADVQWFFDSIQDKINDAWNQRVWNWWCASMINSGDLEVPSDGNWWSVHWQGPPKLTADAGRQIMGDIAALDAGLGNLNLFYSARGQAWKNQTTQRIQEVKYAMEQCQAMGVPYDKVYPQKAGAPAAGGGMMGSSGGGGAEPSAQG